MRIIHSWVRFTKTFSPILLFKEAQRSEPQEFFCENRLESPIALLREWRYKEEESNLRRVILFHLIRSSWLISRQKVSDRKMEMTALHWSAVRTTGEVESVDLAQHKGGQVTNFDTGL